MKARVFFLLTIAMTTMLLISSAKLQTAQASQSSSTAAGEKVWVSNSDFNAQAQLQAQHAQRLADYGTFSLWRYAPGTRTPGNSGSFHPVGDDILLRGITLNPTLSPPAAAAPFGDLLNQDDRPQLWMVQFIGPVKDEWLAQLLSAGLQPVAYVPNYAYVVWGKQPQQTLQRISDELDTTSSVPNPIQWNGPYASRYRLSPDLRLAASTNGSDPPLEVMIQVVTTPDVGDALTRLRALPNSQFFRAYQLAGFTYLRGRTPANKLAEIAAWPDVFNIEGALPPQLLDEAQDQIIAGSVLVDGSLITPSSPGYLNWLASKGFPTDPAAYPVVEVIDDGLDSGNANAILHPDFYEFGNPLLNDRVARITNCTVETSGNGVGGHGNLNAGIIAGYNDQSGFPYEDSLGFQFGLGVSPYGRIASTKAFTNDGTFDLSQCGSSEEDYPALMQQVYAGGARITSNSWGSTVQGAYTTASQVFDALTRDASSQPGLQEMLHVLAAGNRGPGAATINSPGSAKNVLTVGASENVRDGNTSDGCSIRQASSAGNIASFSSRGPTMDLRMKPDLVAPGTHIQGPASQDAAYTGSAICGGANSLYYPDLQTLYTWSSGTSHSTPAAAGAAQLVYEYYGRVLQPGSTPSPAMLKALLLNSPRYLTGTSAGGPLPNPAQGWGGLSLGTLLDDTPRIVLDQEIVFTETGQDAYVNAQIADATRGINISLVWSDAPGNPAAGAAWVNDLDLEVLINGQVYTGNTFVDGTSISGSGFDARNNVENIFLPPGQSGSLLVRVIARNIAGDGLPGNDDSTDQDFALVISNGLRSAVQLSTAQWRERPDSSNKNGYFEPGEMAALTFSLRNSSSIALSGLNVTLTTQNSVISVLPAEQVFLSLAANQSVNSASPFVVKLPPELACGGRVDFNLMLSADGGYQQVIPLTPLWIGANQPTIYPASGLPMDIPDASMYVSGRVSVALPISDNFALSSVAVQVSIDHLIDGNLTLSLRSPMGSEILLSRQNGGNGDDYQNTIFDADNSFFIRYAQAPFNGHFRPEQTLSSLRGQNIAGVWWLDVTDSSSGVSGKILDFRLIGQQASCQIPTFHQLRFPVMLQNGQIMAPP